MLVDDDNGHDDHSYDHDDDNDNEDVQDWCSMQCGLMMMMAMIIIV